MKPTACLLTLVLSIPAAACAQQVDTRAPEQMLKGTIDKVMGAILSHGRVRRSHEGR